LSSGGEVGALHGVQTVNGVPQGSWEEAQPRGGHQAVTQAGQGGVAVHLVEDGLVT